MCNHAHENRYHMYLFILIFIVNSESFSYVCFASLIFGEVLLKKIYF